MDFFKTVAGRDLVERTLPSIARSLDKLSSNKDEVSDLAEKIFLANISFTPEMAFVEAENFIAFKNNRSTKKLLNKK